MKTIIEEAMAVYMNELEKISVIRNDAYYKASNAMHRGDARNYNVWAKKVQECNDRQIELNNELNELKAAYAGV